MPIEVNGEISQVPAFKTDPLHNATKSKNNVVKFKVVKNAPPKRSTSKGFVDSVMPPEMFAASYTRVSLTGNPETVRYFKSAQRSMKNGAMENTYTPEFLTIEGGVMTVNQLTDPDLYYFLHNHPRSRTCPLYDVEHNPDAHAFLEAFQQQGTPFIFEEIYSSRTAKEEISKQRELNANIETISEYTKEQASMIYRAMNLPEADMYETAQDYDSMKLGIITKMKDNPAYWVKLQNDTGVSIRARIKDALLHEVIQDADGRCVWYKTSEEKKKPLILQYANFDKREDELYEYLRTTDKGIKIANELKTEIHYAKRNPDVQRFTNKVAQ